MGYGRWAVILLLTAWGGVTAHASDVGTTAADFLKLGIGPRAIAMGNAQVGLADDVYSTYWNPAGLARLETPEVGFVQNQDLENITEQYAAFAYPTSSRGTFGASLTYLNAGTFPGYDAAANPIGNVGANDMSVSLSYARSIYRDRRMGTDVSLGLTGRMIQERLDTVSARAYAADAGILIKPGLQAGGLLEGWKAGLTIRNLGTSLQYDTDSFPLPRSLDAGLSYTGVILDENVVFTLDGRQPNDGRRTFGTGLEVTTLQTLILRIGYDSEGDLGNGLRLGVGLKFKTIEVDYAFAAQGALGNTSYIGLTYRFRQVRPDPVNLAETAYQKGLKEYRNRRFTEALVDFNKALELDTSNPDALRMMKQTYEQIKIITPE
jgi:hypothetical protein